MNNKVRIGIIGCGGIANQKHLPALSQLSDLCELVAFCDKKIERAEKAKEKFGTESSLVFSNYEELLKLDLDAVHVLTPNVDHSPISVKAFNAGKHVLCEKPMAHNTESAKKMMDAWEKSGKKFTIGYQNRFRPEVQALKKSCELNELGDIYYAKAHAVRRRAVPTWGVFPNKALQGGGPLIDIGTHALDITLWMMNNYQPKSVSGTVFHKMADQFEGNIFGPWDPNTFEVEDSAMGMIHFKNGAVVYLESSWAINLRESKEAATTLCGTKAGAEIISGMSYETDDLIINKAQHGLLMEERKTQGGAIAYFEGTKKDPGFLENKQWLEAIIHDKEPLVKPIEAFNVTKILNAIYESARLGKEVTFDE
jgi:predicted dehydrogenase